MALKLNGNTIINEAGKTLLELTDQIVALQRTVDTQANTIKSLQTTVTDLNSRKEVVLWDGEVKANTTTNSTITLSNMPNLANYHGYNIKFYLQYGGNTYVVERRMRDSAQSLFVDVCRDYSGNNDIWFILFCFHDLNSKNWSVKTVHSFQIQNTTINAINSNNYTWTLFRITATKV